MKRMISFHRLLAMLMAVLLCGIPTIFVSARDIQADEVNPAYTVNGINAYKDPYAASLHFNVEKMIYFAADQAPENVSSDSRVIVVTTMDDLIAMAKKYPFAALVVDADAEPLLNRNAIVQLSQTQHVILIVGFDAVSEKDLDTYAQLTGKSVQEYEDLPCFAAYYVASATGEIPLWNILWGQNFTADDILDFAEDTKKGIFYLYDSLVLQEHPEFAEEINNAPVPQRNIIAQTNMELYADWDTSVNNRVEIFNPGHLLTSTSTNVYAEPNGGNKIMTSYVGEALLFTGSKELIDGYYWYAVRGWKQSGSGTTFVSGWIRAFGSYWHAVDTECYTLYENGMKLNDNNVSGVTCNSSRNEVGYTLRSAAKLYNSSGTVLRTLSRGDKVWIDPDEGYAGATRPYLVSISGYSIGGTYYTASSTCFADLNFDSGDTATYRIVTHS